MMLEIFGVNIWQILILCPLIFLSGFVDSIAGGGGLISLPAYMIIGLPVHLARGTNKISSALGTATSTIKYARTGFIPIREAIVCVIFALAGSSIGTKLGLLVDEKIFTIIMLVIIPITAAYVWLHKKNIQEREPYSGIKTTVIACAIAFALGIYDGFYGPGTGTFLIILLTAVAHMKINEANGVAKVINLATNVASVVIFITSGKALIPLGLLASVFSIAGNYVGSRLFIGKGTKIVRPVMILVLAIFFVKIITEL